MEKNAKPLKISIYTIVVTYNGTKWINKCIDSLIKSSVCSRIVIIDNGSTDGTQEKIKKDYPTVQLIQSKINLGFGKANNLGIKKAYDEGSEFVFLLNQDACVETDTIEKLINAQKNNPEYLILSPVHLNGEGSAIDRGFQDYISPNNTEDFISDLYLGKLKNIYSSRYCNAAAWLLTRECLDKVGGFDPLFLHYGEDDDYILRLLELGYKIGIVTDPKIYHDRPQSRASNKMFHETYFYTRALLKVKKSKNTKTFRLRRLQIAYYFLLYFVYLGKNKEIRNFLKINRLAISIKRREKNINFSSNIPL